MHRYYTPSQPRRLKSDSFTETSDLSVFGRLFLVIAIFVAGIAAFNQLVS